MTPLSAGHELNAMMLYEFVALVSAIGLSIGAYIEFREASYEEDRYYTAVLLCLAVVVVLIFFGTALVWIIFAVIAAGSSYWWRRHGPAAKDSQSAQEHAKRLANRTALVAAQSAKATLPSEDEFAEHVLAELRKSDKRQLHDAYLLQLVNVFKIIYRDRFKPGPNPRQAFDVFFRTCVDGLLGFTEQVPPVALASTETSPFSVGLDFLQYVRGATPEKDAFPAIPGVRDALTALAKPFKNAREILNLNFKWSDFSIQANAIEPNRGDFSEYSDYERAQNEYNRVRERAYDRVLEWEWPLVGTPLFPYSLHLLPNEKKMRVPLIIPDELRFRHTFIVGDTGSGKTTLLSNLIKADLDRVAKGEASIFVMDSQNELVPQIAKLEIFAPGGTLHGKLVYLEPDPDYPLALNIFDVDRQRLQQLSSKERAMLESGAIWMVDFFLGSLVKSEATPHMDTFLNYLIQGVMAIPDATVFTVKDLLEPAKERNGPTGYDHFKHHFVSLHPDTQRWLAERMHSTELAQTRNAIRARLDGFTARSFFRDMFTSPRNKFDFFQELQRPKVILINTMKGLMKGATEPFGRYFIARLLQATEERMFLSKASKLPVFVYLDEASDYISDEKNIAEIIDRARKQKVSLTAAVQRTSQITNANVLDALKRAAIQCWGQKQPIWNLALDRSDPIQVNVPLVDFGTFPQMTDSQWGAILQEMRRRYANSSQDSLTVPMRQLRSLTEELDPDVDIGGVTPN